MVAGKLSSSVANDRRQVYCDDTGVTGVTAPEWRDNEKLNLDPDLVAVVAGASEGG